MLWAEPALIPSAAARLLGITQAEVIDLMYGRINLFGLDALIHMAVSEGMHLEITIREVV